MTVRVSNQCLCEPGARACVGGAVEPRPTCGLEITTRVGSLTPVKCQPSGEHPGVQCGDDPTDGGKLLSGSASAGRRDPSGVRHDVTLELCVTCERQPIAPTQFSIAAFGLAGR